MEEMAREDVLLSDTDDGVLTLTLNRPASRNALSSELRRALCAAFADAAASSDIRAVILTGSGEAAFCAGLDLNELGGDPSVLREISDRNPSVNPVEAMLACPVPVIVAINGAAFTGGFELALAGDILIASTAAFFADTHLKVGVLPGWGLSQRLSRIVGAARANDVHFSGRRIDAATALDWGIVSRLTAPDELMSVAGSIARSIAAVDETCAKTMKSLLNGGAGLPLAEALEFERRTSSAWNSIVTAVTRPDFRTPSPADEPGRS